MALMKHSDPVCDFSRGVWCCVTFPLPLNDAPSLLPQFSSVNNQSHEIMKSYEGTGISPFLYTQNCISLVVGTLNSPSCVFINVTYVIAKSHAVAEKQLMI